MAEKLKVLVVDDEEICVLVTAKILEHLGMDALVAHDGVEAVNIYGENSDSIDCVIMDIQMPRMNGIEAFKRLKTIREDVKVVIASGYVNDTNKALIDPLEPVGYIQKPLTFDNLTHFMKKIVPN
ncbi:MAG: response regulator [Desulfocapsaceae bacterium]|nr:response regulator [Desulfocapsaceae bacterium]